MKVKAITQFKRTTSKFMSDETNEKVHKDSPESIPRSKRLKVNSPIVVTPSPLDVDTLKIKNEQTLVRRSLVIPPSRQISNTNLLTSSSPLPSNDNQCFAFGRSSGNEIIPIKKRTRNVYKLINKMTGSIGGNGHGGAIYGELTVGSMQKMVNLMKVHTNFGADSRFIDVGSGLGKPNLHVAQDPGVSFSYGIEMEHVRWMLGMSNLNLVLQTAQKQKGTKAEDHIGHKCIFQHGDIREAKYFDPFTHVYMFDIGFPPILFKQLAEIFNRSQSPYLICYHGPKLMVERYKFDVELIIQAQTSMHGSSEGHSGYIYRRVLSSKKKIQSKCPFTSHGLPQGIPCDPLFSKAWKFTQRDVEPMLKDVKSLVTNNLSTKRPRRKRKALKRFGVEQ